MSVRWHEDPGEPFDLGVASGPPIDEKDVLASVLEIRRAEWDRVEGVICGHHPIDGPCSRSHAKGAWCVCPCHRMPERP